MLVMDKQGRYLSREDVKRYNGENVICVNGYPWGDLNKVKTELLKNPSIETVSWGSTLPSMSFNVTSEWKEKDNKVMAVTYNYEPDFPKVYQIKMLGGRFLSYEFPSDMENGIVINPIAVAELGYTDPVGKTVLLNNKLYTIVGVIDNYMALPPIFDNMPLLITQSRDLNDFLFIRIRPGGTEAIKAFITKTLKQFNPDYPVELKYHDEVMYGTREAKSWIAISRLMHVFFMIIIIASLIGVFGLSLFISQRNRKKVVILKVFGASVPAIMAKLTRGILLQVTLAFLMATPVSIMFSNQYMATFPIHSKPGIWLFLSGGAMTMVLVLVTVSWQTWKTAVSNPAESLKYE